MKRVCFVTSVWLDGGCETVLPTLAEELTNLGCKVDFLCLSEPQSPIKSPKVNLSYINLAERRENTYYIDY